MTFFARHLSGMLRRCAPVAAAVFLLAQPAAAQEDNNDPLEEFNRAMFGIHNAVDKVVLVPVARTYRFIVPEPGRQGVRNFLRNLNSPVIFANDIFQGEVDRAGTTLVRFGINSTLGVAGLFDPATEMGFERHTEDFGQTLAVHGVSEGPYLFLPLFGPSPPRDLVGRGVDRALDPITWVGGEDFQYFKYGRTAINVIDLRARNLESLEEIERTSIDYYAAVRSVYRQSREGAIRNGEYDFDDLPDLSDEFEDF